MRQDDGGTTVAGRPPGAGEVRLVVSRDFGGEILRDVVVPAGDGLDVMRLLAENADVTTAYGGGFVESIDGLASSFAGGSEGAADWFFWVDGALGDVGAADWALAGGETVWWDYHAWAGAMVVPAALHAFPRPYAAGPVALTAAADVTGLDEWAAASGLELEPRRGLSGGEPHGGLVLATAAEVAATPWLRDLLGERRSGLVLVRATREGLTLVVPGGDAGPAAAAVAQPVTNPADPARPFLVVLGATRSDIATMLPLLTPASLTARVGAALVGDELIGLPRLES